MSYKVNLNDFEGPLDLLLFFIKRDKLNIYDIPISKITNDFLDYISKLNNMNIEVGAEFIYMASLLMNIKSKMLLPVNSIQEEEFIDPRENLMLRLLEYKKYKNISYQLSKVMDNYNLTHRTIIPPNQDLNYTYSDSSAIEEFNLYDIIETYAHLINQINSKAINYEIDFETVSVNDQIIFIKDILKKQDKISFTNLIKAFNNQIYLIYTFIAILEMVKSKKIKIKQDKMFSEIYIISI